MFLKPQSATTSNIKSVEIIVSANTENTEIVSGNTETDESIEPKKRGRKPNPLNYFAEREERAVRLFLTAST